MSGIFEGIRVLDLGRFISAPFGSQLMADLGADVIKVERAGKGDDGRRLGPFHDGVSMYVPTFSRNKRGVTVNFRTDNGKKVFRELVKSADVIYENFRPGTMAKMGFSYEEIKKINPRIIMVSISGFGQEGKYRDRAAFNDVVTAMSCFMSLNNLPDGTPMGTGVPAADHIAGLYASFAVAAALYDRQKTGQGQYIDMSMMDCMISFLETSVPNASANGFNSGHRTHTGDPLTVPTNTFKTKNGYVNIHAGTDPNYKNFAPITKDPILNDPKYLKIEARMKDYDLINDTAAKWFLTVTCEEAEQLLAAAGIPVAIVYDLQRLLHDSNTWDRRQVVNIDVPGIGPVGFPGNPIKMKTRPLDAPHRAPMMGEHNEEIYSELGFTREELDKLASEGDI